MTLRKLMTVILFTIMLISVSAAHGLADTDSAITELTDAELDIAASLEAYAPVLEEFRAYLTSGYELYEAELLTEPWSSMLPDRPWIGSEFGYAVVDINMDGINELLLVTLQQDDDSIWEGTGQNPRMFINAIYTLSTNEDTGKLEPVFVDVYWARHKAAIAEWGSVYVHGSSGASDNFCAEYKLPLDNSVLLC